MFLSPPEAPLGTAEDLGERHEKGEDVVPSVDFIRKYRLRFIDDLTGFPFLPAILV
jgi:hypothetical protein